jgi:nucleotide-binding universal stress UspA family protein
MDAAVSSITLSQLRVRSVIEVGDTRDIVLEQATLTSADLIVMGTHGRTGLRHAVPGSIAEAVVRRSKVPVLTLRHDEDRRL